MFGACRALWYINEWLRLAFAGIGTSKGVAPFLAAGHETLQAKIAATKAKNACKKHSLQWHARMAIGRKKEGTGDIPLATSVFS
jgi:hypothetical protein